jgi:hypothetical protein
MNRITSTFEKQVTEQDHRKRGYMSRAQEIKAQIKKLEGELEEVERDCSQEESSMKWVTSSLHDHRRRSDDATAIRAQLELLSSQDRELLNQADTLINHVMPDGSASPSAPVLYVISSMLVHPTCNLDLAYNRRATCSSLILFLLGSNVCPLLYEPYSALNHLW